MSTIDAARISNLVNQSCQKSSKGTGTASEDIGNDYKIVAETRYSKNFLKRLFGIKRKTLSLISLKENKETTIQSFDLTKGKALNEVAENLNNLVTKSKQATEGENTQASPLEKFDAACEQAESILSRREMDKGAEVHKENIQQFINALKTIGSAFASSQEKEEALAGLKTLIDTSRSNTLDSGKFEYSPLSESLIAIMSGGNVQADFDPEINELRGLCRDMLLGAIESVQERDQDDKNTLPMLENALQIVDMRKYIELKGKDYSKFIDKGHN